MRGRSGERGSGISVLAAWHDDDDDDINGYNITLNGNIQNKKYIEILRIQIKSKFSS